MSKTLEKKRAKSPVQFVPVNSETERKGYIRQAVKSFAATTIWTEKQKHLIQSHFSGYVEGGKGACIFFWVPKDFDEAVFVDEMKRIDPPICHFSVALNAAHVFFKSAFIGIDPVEGFQFQIPEEIFKIQRRKDFRLPIPDGYLIKVEFQDPYLPENDISKKIFDISGGGLAFLVDHEEDSFFEEGQILRRMKFRIRGREIIADGEVRYLKPLLFHQRLKGVKVGIQFVHINRHDAERIRSYVMEESQKYFSKFY